MVLSLPSLSLTSVSTLPISSPPQDLDLLSSSLSQWLLPCHYRDSSCGFTFPRPPFSIMVSFRSVMFLSIAALLTLIRPASPWGTHSIRCLTSVFSLPNRLICLYMGTWFTHRDPWVVDSGVVAAHAGLQSGAVIDCQSNSDSLSHIMPYFQNYD